MEQTQYSETSAIKHLMPENIPKDYTQQQIVTLTAELFCKHLIYSIHLYEGYCSWGVRPTTPPSSVEVKNKWNCKPAAAVCHHGIC